MQEETVDVMFRFDREGEVFALFPGLAGTYDPYTCLCYQHVGQHCSADPLGCVHTSRPAKPAEYADLKAELEGAPYHYVLRVIHRQSARHLGEREQQLMGVEHANR